MKKVAFAIVFFLLCLEFKGIKSKARQQTFIIGGTDANLGQFPYQVSLRISNGRHFCGGSIIDKRWVLSAAHCFTQIQPEYMMVGTTTLSTGGVRYDVLRTISHYFYDGKIVRNDIALVRTKVDIVFNNAIKPIGIPKANPTIGTDLIASGWGDTTAGVSSGPENLKFVTLKTITNSDCVKMYGGTEVMVFGTNLCTAPVSGKGTCQGDSGGPLASSDFLYGITSFGISCGTPNYPDIYTNVASYRYWIFWKKLIHRW